MRLFLARSLLGFSAFLWFLFFHAVCVPQQVGHPNRPQCSQQPPNPSALRLASPNSDRVRSFLPALHQVWWHPQVLLHKEEMLAAAVAV